MYRSEIAILSLIGPFWINEQFLCENAISVDPVHSVLDLPLEENFLLVLGQTDYWDLLFIADADRYNTGKNITVDYYNATTLQ